MKFNFSAVSKHLIWPVPGSHETNVVAQRPLGPCAMARAVSKMAWAWGGGGGGGGGGERRAARRGK